MTNFRESFRIHLPHLSPTARGKSCLPQAFKNRIADIYISQDIFRLVDARFKDKMVYHLPDLFFFPPMIQQPIDPGSLTVKTDLSESIEMPRVLPD